MIHSDSHFMIGHSHTICEDFASNLGEFAALADGCSAVMDDNGVRMEAHTDIGARLLVRAAFHHASADSELLGPLTIHTADSYRRQLDLPLHTLSATLGCIRPAAGMFDCHLFGDGVVAARQRNGEWSWQVISFGGRPPRYLRYDLRDRDRVAYGESHGDTTDHYPHWVHWPISHYDLALITSDGASSFTRDHKPLAFVELAERLLDFRRMKGRFVLRHLTGILKELARDGIVPQDDVSMIALYDDGETNA